MNNIKELWYSRDARERMMIGLCLVFVAFVLFWMLVLDPIDSKLKQLRSQVPAKQETLAYMQAQQETLQYLDQSGEGPEIDRSIPILTVIEQTARQSNLRDVIKRIQPDEDDTVKVWLSNVFFDPWVLWVEVLKQQGIEVVSATVNRSKEENTVSVRVTFQRG